MKTYTLENKEVATLLFHMSVMRNAVKKGFKKTYGVWKKEYRTHIKKYDSVVEKLKTLASNEGETYLLELDEQEHEIFESFMTWYVKELEKELGENVTDDAEEGLLILKNIIHELEVCT